MTEISRRKALRKHRAARRRKPKGQCFVYALMDGDECFYVGQTRQILTERLRWHHREVARRKARGLRLSPAQQRIAPGIKIQMLDDKGTWDIAEAVWIDRMSARGHKLLNVLSCVA